MTDFQITHEATYDTGLVFWGYMRSCVMSNGDAVIYGKTSYDAPAEFHVYNTKGRKIKTFKTLCHHEGNTNLFSQIIQNINYLFLSCCYCNKIYQYNMNTTTVTEAFSDDKYRPGRMCHGPPGTICVVNRVNDNPVLVLNCTTTSFRLERTVQTQMQRYHSICYVPSVDLLLITNCTLGMVRAVSCSTDRVVWEVTGDVAGSPCDPHGAVYSPQHDVVFVCDGTNERILVLEPVSGECLQTVDLREHVDVAWDPYLRDDQLILRHKGTDGKPKLSYYKVCASFTIFITEL